MQLKDVQNAKKIPITFLEAGLTTQVLNAILGASEHIQWNLSNLDTIGAD